MVGAFVYNDANVTTDYMGVCTAYFEWADSYDTKDWERLRKIVAPTLRVRLPTQP